MNNKVSTYAAERGFDQGNEPSLSPDLQRALATTVKERVVYLYKYIERTSHSAQVAIVLSLLLIGLFLHL